MKKGFKGTVFIVFAIVLAIVGMFLMKNSVLKGYSILCFAVALVAFLIGIRLMVNASNPERLYESTVREILNTYDSILVKSNSVPKLESRNVILVESMDDLVDAQLEIRKPICYLKQSESCSFVLLDDKEAYVYVEKLKPDIVSPLEIEMKEARFRIKNAEEMDSEMLREIDKTTIVKLSNKKSYKVSPVRKEQKKIQEEILESVSEKQKQSQVETIEPLEEIAIPKEVEVLELPKGVDVLGNTLALPKVKDVEELEETLKIHKIDEIEVL